MNTKKILVGVVAIVLIALGATFYFNDGNLFKGQMAVRNAPKSDIRESKSKETPVFDAKISEVASPQEEITIEKPDLKFQSFPKMKAINFNGNTGVGYVTIDNKTYYSYKDPSINIFIEPYIKNIMAPVEQVEVKYLVDNKTVETFIYEISKEINSGKEVFWFHKPLDTYLVGSKSAKWFKLSDISNSFLSAKCIPHTFTVMLDSKNQISESDESNNSASLTYTIMDDGTAVNGDLACKNSVPLPSAPSAELETEFDFETVDKNNSPSSGYGDKPKELIDIPKF